MLAKLYEITKGSKSIPINLLSVKDILDLLAGDLPVDGDEEEGKTRFLSLFGLSEVKKIRFFGDKIKNDELNDDEFCQCFMGVALGTFLCPNSSTKIGTKYLGALVDVRNIRNRNWCKFVVEWLIFYIKKYLGDKRKEKRVSGTLGGCIYALTVRCLDFKDFGAIKLPTTLPRIRVWKGHLIKQFSDMDIGNNGKYGALQIKDITQTCYEYKSNITDAELRESIQEILENSIGDLVKLDMIKTFQVHMKDQEPKFLSLAHGFFLDILRNIKTSAVDSEDTVIVDSSGANRVSTNTIEGDSGSTGKILECRDEELEADEECEGLVPRKKRKLTEQSSSQQSSSLNNATVKQNDMIADHHGIENINLNPQGLNVGINANQVCDKTASLDYLIPKIEQQNCTTGYLCSASQSRCHGVSNEVAYDAKIEARCIDPDHGNSSFSGFVKVTSDEKNPNKNLDVSKAAAAKSINT